MGKNLENKIDENKIKEAAAQMLTAIGEDPGREGLLETPERIARMYSEIFSGLHESPEAHLQRTFTVEENNLVMQKNIDFYSMCEHHFLPFFGQVHIAYIPQGKVVGLSKLARTVEVFAKRPQLQERLSSQIAEAIMKYLNPQGVMVVVEAEHLCMQMRGVKKQGSKTTTMAVQGVFREDDKLRAEVLSMI